MSLRITLSPQSGPVKIVLSIEGHDYTAWVYREGHDLDFDLLGPTDQVPRRIVGIAKRMIKQKLRARET